MDHIVLEGCSCVGFINVVMAVQDLATQYQAGQLSSPAVKIWWTGARYIFFYHLLHGCSVGALVAARVLPQLLRVIMTRWQRQSS